MNVILIILSVLCISGLITYIPYRRSQRRFEPDSFLNGPQGPWVGPMAETVAVIFLKRPPFISFNIDNRPHQIIEGQHWAEMAKREEIMKLLKAVREEAQRYLGHYAPGIPGHAKEELYLYQLCQEDSTLLLAILDGRILVGRK